MSKKAANLQERRDKYDEARGILKRFLTDIGEDITEESVNSIKSDNLELSCQFETVEEFKKRIQRTFPGAPYED